MNHRGCHAVLLRRFEDDARCRRVGQLGGLPEKRIQQVDHVELPEPIDLEVAVDMVVSLSVLIYVDAGGKNELRHVSAKHPDYS